MVPNKCHSFICNNVIHTINLSIVHLRISLGVILLKDVFHVYTNPLKTPHYLIKKKQKKTLKIKIDHSLYLFEAYTKP